MARSTRRRGCQIAAAEWGAIRICTESGSSQQGAVDETAPAKESVETLVATGRNENSS